MISTSSGTNCATTTARLDAVSEVPDVTPKCDRHVNPDRQAASHIFRALDGILTDLDDIQRMKKR